jgi:cation:H+ antiporter
MTFLILSVGLVVLTVGAEILVRGASALALAIRISPLVIGLTVVAFGTSAPELVVSLQSAWRGQADVAMGNVIGSNIFNILLILGVAALITPLVVSQQLVRVDVPLMIGVSLLVWAMAMDGRLGRLDGLFLTMTLIVYTTWLIRMSRREQATIRREYIQEFGDPEDVPTSMGQFVIQVLFVVVGLAMLVVGARMFTDGAVNIARSFGVSELVIGITLVAAGTSLPEAATSFMAAIRGERDIAVGNAVGSNLFNLMAVLGISSLVSPQGINVSPIALRVDMPVMIGVAIACLPVFLTGHLIARWEGVLFLGYLAAYTAYLILDATESAIQHTFVVAILGVALPLTMVILGVAVKRHCGGTEASEI